MGREPSISRLESNAAIAAIAERHQGYVTFRELRRLGLGSDAIAYRVKTGRLYIEHFGVYGVGHRRRDPIARASAAVLACGDGAVLSHGSAAGLWGFFKRWDEPFEVTVPVDRRPRGIKVHLVKHLAGRDVRTHHGIRVTSPARTVLDIAPRHKRKQLTRVVNDGRLSGHLGLDALADVIERTPRHPGARLLRPFVESRRGPTRSEFEDAFQEFVERFGLPQPQINTKVLGHEVDAYFPEQRLVVELDGWEFHRDRGAFERDRNKDADLLRASIATVRITWERLTEQDASEAARLQTILATRRAA